MKRLILSKIAKRFLNEKGKRIVFLVSLYWLLSKTKGLKVETQTIADVIGVKDKRSINFPLILSEVVWEKNVMNRAQRLATLSEDKYKRYIRYILPCCLRYGDSKNSPYSVDNDITSVLHAVK